MSATIAQGGSGLCGLCFNSDGQLFVASARDSRVLLAEQGQLLDFSSTGGSPQGLAIDRSGTVLVADAAHGAVLELGEDGRTRVIFNEFERVRLRVRVGARAGARRLRVVVQATQNPSPPSPLLSPTPLTPPLCDCTPQGPHSLVIDSAGALYFTDAGPDGDTGLHSPLGSVFVMSQRVLRPIALRCLARPTGIALSPNEAALFVAEAAQNRVLRYTQRPPGVWHGTVFFQFAGRLGPSALVVDRAREFLYVARPEALDGAAGRGAASVVAVLSLEGKLLKEFAVPGVGPDVTSMALSPDGKDLLVAESSSSTIVAVTL